jgi:hypothetical protein
MKRGPRKENAAALSEKERLFGLRRALTQLVGTFGYDAVRKTLTLVNKEIGNRNEKGKIKRKRANLADKNKLDSEEDRDSRALQVWLAVNQMQAKLGEGASARAACDAIKKTGGIKRFRSGNQLLGIGPTVDWHLDKKETIYRRYTDAEQLRKSDPDIDAHWRRTLAESLAVDAVHAKTVSHSPQPDSAWLLPWRPGLGKAGQK